MTNPSSRSTSTPLPMNRYGRMAWDQWETHRPHEVAAIANPLVHFSMLGELIESEISTEITTRMTADPSQDKATVEAEVTEIVLHETIWSQTTRDNSDSTLSGNRVLVDETLVEEIPIAFDDTTNLARWAASPLTQPNLQPESTGGR